MTINMSEAELLRLGFTVDPGNPSQAVSVKADDQPDDSWTFERLMTYGCAAVSESDLLDHEAICIARRSTIHVFRAGRALSFARSKVPLGHTWEECLRQHGIPRTNAWEAIQLFKRARSEAAVTQLTPAEAKLRFKITKPKRSAKHEEPDRFPKTSDDDQGDDGPFEAEGCLKVVYDDEHLDSDDELAGDEEVDDIGEDPSDEAPCSETVLELLVSINADLRVAVSLPVEDEDRERIEAEIVKAHKFLDQFEMKDVDDAGFLTLSHQAPTTL